MWNSSNQIQPWSNLIYVSHVFYPLVEKRIELRGSNLTLTPSITVFGDQRMKSEKGERTSVLLRTSNANNNSSDSDLRFCKTPYSHIALYIDRLKLYIALRTYICTSYWYFIRSHLYHHKVRVLTVLILSTKMFQHFFMDFLRMILQKKAWNSTTLRWYLKLRNFYCWEHLSIK